MTDLPPISPGEAVIVRVRAEHHIGEAQWAARELARRADLSLVALYSTATAASELANNLVFHALTGGVMTFAVVRQPDRVGVRVTAVDEGPGIPDIEMALRDGFTTNGGLGGGLPGVRRLMDEFDITSTVGRGTRIVTCKWRMSALEWPHDSCGSGFQTPREDRGDPGTEPSSA